MRHVKADDLRRLAGQLEALVAILRKDPDCKCGHKTKAEHAHHVAKSAYGAPGSNQGGRGSKGDHSDPTYAAFMRPDVSDHWLDDLSLYAENVMSSGANLARLVHDLGTITPTSPRELSANGSGDCQACGDFNSGAVNDRLRGGFCNACRMAYQRAGCPDRFEFCRDRRAQLQAEKNQRAG